MPTYPEKVREIIIKGRSDVDDETGVTNGTAASFECGCFVMFAVSTASAARRVDRLSFRSNGCGYMLASADLLTEWFRSRSLVDLHGLERDDLISRIQAELGGLPNERVQCAAIAINALRRAFEVHRQKQVEEFRGERAIVCTCFGISEDTIDEVTKRPEVTSVEDVTDICRAGAGCGSCRMVIADMLDEQIGRT